MKIAKDAKECVQECVSEFISFITSEYPFLKERKSNDHNDYTNSNSNNNIYYNFFQFSWMRKHRGIIWVGLWFVFRLQGPNSPHPCTE